MSVITIIDRPSTIISAASGEKGTFLSIDRLSVQAVVERTLQGLGLEFTHRPTARNITRQGMPGLRTFDQWALNFDVQGPMGEPMKALLRIQDTTVPGMAFRVQLGVFRLVCLNGMFGFGETFETRVTHRVGQSALAKLDGLPAAIETALKNLPALSAAAEGLATVDVVDPIDVLMSLNVPEKVREGALRIVARQTFRPEDQPANAWGLYNIVNEVDRLLARQGSTAFLERDERLADDIVCLASAQEAA